VTVPEAKTADTAPPAGYDLDGQVGYLLRLATQRHAAIFQAHSIAGLTPMQFSALIRLSTDGPCSQNQLGRRAAMDIATIKGVVDRLRQKGLVTTRPSRQDRRRMQISLTEEGAALIADLQSAGHVITDETLKPLTPAERRTFVKLLRKLT
jgi:DNA-binding MarR family transcriptional regulator